VNISEIGAGGEGVYDLSEFTEGRNALQCEGKCVDVFIPVVGAQYLNRLGSCSLGDTCAQIFQVGREGWDNLTVEKGLVFHVLGKGIDILIYMVYFSLCFFDVCRHASGLNRIDKRRHPYSHHGG